MTPGCTIISSRGRTLSLTVALRRLAAETGRCAELGLELQDRLSEALGPRPCERAVAAAQSLDLLCQTLAEIARCLDAAAANTPANARLDPERLVRGVLLADLAARLADLPPSAVAAASGELDLF
jgi:hypothetical protein